MEKILIDASGGRGVARGLLCRSGGSDHEISADRILVCCGYLNTPLLLMRSGNGPSQWRGNPILVENPNIGKHIDGHPFSPSVSALFERPLGDGEVGSLPGYRMIDDFREDAEGRLFLTANFGVSDFPNQNALHAMAPDFGREHKRFIKKKGVLRTGTIRLRMVNPPGAGSLMGKGRCFTGVIIP